MLTSSRSCLRADSIVEIRSAIRLNPRASRPSSSCLSLRTRCSSCPWARASTPRKPVDRLKHPSQRQICQENQEQNCNRQDDSQHPSGFADFFSLVKNIEDLISVFNPKTLSFIKGFRPKSILLFVFNLRNSYCSKDGRVPDVFHEVSGFGNGY